MELPVRLGKLEAIYDQSNFEGNLRLLSNWFRTLLYFLSIRFLWIAGCCSIFCLFSSCEQKFFCSIFCPFSFYEKQTQGAHNRRIWAMFESYCFKNHGKNTWVLALVVRTVAFLKKISHFSFVLFRSFLTAKLAFPRHWRTFNLSPHSIPPAIPAALPSALKLSHPWLWAGTLCSPSPGTALPLSIECLP